MNELKRFYRITYDSWEGYYVVHTPKGEIWFLMRNCDKLPESFLLSHELTPTLTENSH
jgi:hypothetical protein